ncbi:MAG: Ribosomal small subunit methyltransferase [Chthoniobacteraceae bacterium]|nr:Ribosomal small subunit methyltransferase [Chthoniobacteraceae bacterium]
MNAIAEPEAQKTTPSRTSRRAPFAVKTPRHEYHESVLLTETVGLLEPGAGKLIVDGTLGGGGHSAALLAAGARVIGLDQDPDAIAYASGRLAAFGSNFTPVHSSFVNVREVLDSLQIASINGALLDLGVSSHQIDVAERGFSFMQDGPLDMRMDPGSPLSAADLVNTMSSEQLERIFRSHGEEPAARKIALRLVRDRMVRPFTTTLQLAESIESVVPRHGKTHPATRVFQALRIAVNRELEVLEQALLAFSSVLAPGGRFAVITFHSLEDRIVKAFFSNRSAEWLDRPEWPAPRRNPDFTFKRITRKALVASEAEQRANPRSRSAKLRVVEKL